MLKKSKQKMCTYVFTCYMRTKSCHEKLTFYLANVKKIKFGAKNNTFYGATFVFYTDHIKSRFLRNL
jgi:hypothetical protein